MDAEPIVLFCYLYVKWKLSLLAPSANFITDPPVNPKGDDVYLYKALNAIKEGNYPASLHSVFSISLVV